MAIGFAQLRDLDTSGLSAAADAAAQVGRDLESRAGEITEAARYSGGGEFWGGADAEAQNALLSTLPPPLLAASTVFKTAAGQLDSLVTELDAAKAELETAISSFPQHTVDDDGGVSWPPAPTEEQAKWLQQQAETLLSIIKTVLEKAQGADDQTSGQLAANDPSSGDGVVPVRLPDGSVYLATGDEDDKVEIDRGFDGKVVATVNGKQYEYDAGTPLILNTGGGADTVRIDESVDSDLIVTTGTGQDEVTDAGSGGRIIYTGDDDEPVFSGGLRRFLGDDDDDDAPPRPDRWEPSDVPVPPWQ